MQSSDTLAPEVSLTHVEGTTREPPASGHPPPQPPHPGLERHIKSQPNPKVPEPGEQVVTPQEASVQRCRTQQDRAPDHGPVAAGGRSGHGIRSNPRFSHEFRGEQGRASRGESTGPSSLLGRREVDVSKLDDLKRRVGGTVYFNQSVLSLSKNGYSIDSGTLVSVDGAVCVVEWYECLCLDWHDDSVPCAFRIREQLSTFAVSSYPRRCTWQQ